MKCSIQRARSKTANGGFTLIEIGIVLAIIGIALFFTIGKLTSTNLETKAQSMAQDLTGVFTNAKRLYATQATYNGVTVAILRDNRVFPAEWNQGGTITGPFGGNIVTAAATLTNVDDALKLTVPNVPADVCASIIRMMARGIEVIDVGATNVKANNAQINITTTGTQCAANPTSSVSFTIGKA